MKPTRPALTRRRFLERLGAVGGSSLLMTAMNSWDLMLSAEQHVALVSAIRRRVSEIGLRNFAEENRQQDPLIEMLDILREPDVLLTRTPRVPGLDGRKMSKSYGNAITLSESDDDIRKKTKVMPTNFLPAVGTPSRNLWTCSAPINRCRISR